MSNTVRTWAAIVVTAATTALAVHAVEAQEAPEGGFRRDALRRAQAKATTDDLFTAQNFRLVDGGGTSHGGLTNVAQYTDVSVFGNADSGYSPSPPSAGMSATATYSNVSVSDVSGRDRVVFGVDPKGVCYFEMYDSKGKRRFRKAFK